MLEIEAFNGILYNKEKISDISKVIAPPYDVISPDTQEKLYKLSPYNVVRLILTKGEAPQKYEKAAKIYKEWRNKNILRSDDLPAIYVMLQKFSYGGKSFTRKGFIALKKLSSGSVFPHEKTFSKPKEDRYSLMQTTHANFEEVFVLYSDKDKAMSKIIDASIKKKPHFSGKEFDGTIVKLWKIQDPGIIEKIKKIMLNKKLLIADGHHRYETAVKFSNENKDLSPASDYIPLYFDCIEDKGILVLPILRMVRGADKENLKDFAQNAGKYFKVKKVKQLPVLKVGQLAAYVGKGVYYIIDVRDKSKIPAGRNLDLDILHELIIGKVLNISSDDKHIVYTKDKKELVKMVDCGQFQMGFLMSGFLVKAALDIASKGYLLPQKSTYFYPKVPSGLVMREM